MMTRIVPPFLVEPQIVKIADALADVGFIVLENAVTGDCLSRWRKRALTLHSAGALKPAEIGRSQSQEVAPEVRSDSIAWLDSDSEDEDDIDALTFVDQLMRSINKSLYLSLDHAEIHFALYPPGGHYRKHLDRHRDSEARVISFILYLNETWKPEWGGQLKIYDVEDNLIRSIEPEGGTLALFRSEQFPHEVVTATQNRISLTGWLRRRT